jgi:zinc protease
LVSMVGSIAAGDRRTSDDTLAHLHAQMLLEGTKRFTKKELQIELDAMGAILSFNATNDRLKFFARARTKHIERLLEITLEALSNPTFPEGELAILKKREEANLIMQAQDTNAQASIHLSRMLYPKTHPNFEESTEEALGALRKVSTKSLHDYHHRAINRNTLVLAMGGDIDPKNVFALADHYFAPLPTRRVAKVKVPRAHAPKAQCKAVFIKEKANIDYYLANPTRITNTHKDFPALNLGLQILGNRSGFTGRLMQIVREKEGLTYGIYSMLRGFSYDIDGHALTYVSFGPQTFDQGRASTLREIRRITTEGVSEDEVTKHANLYAASTRVSLSSAGTLARVAHDTIVDHKPLSYIDDYSHKTLKLTAKEVNRVLKKYINPDKLVESAAGPIRAIKG